MAFHKDIKLKTIVGAGAEMEDYGDRDNGVFCGCTSLTAIEIPASVETIESVAFKDCTNLQTVTFAEGSNLVTIGGGDSSGYGAFANCPNLTLFDASNCSRIRTIHRKALYESEKITFKITMPVPPIIGYDCFYTASSTSVKICVPMQYVDTYKTDEYWDSYSKLIVGYDFE